VSDVADNRHVIVEDETLAAGFTQIPNAVLRRADLSAGAKLTYMMLLSYAWQADSCYPGQDRLAADMGVSERSVITYLKQLSESGLVSIRRRGLGLTNVYVLHRFNARGEKFADQEVQDSTPLEVQGLQPKKTQLKKTQLEEDSSSSRNPIPEFDKERDELRQIVTDFARELGDEAPLSSTLSRVVAIYRRSGLDLDTFFDRLYQARAVTQERSASISKTQQGNGAFARKNKIPYFLRVLEGLVDGASNVVSETGKNPG
jgi:hypothetical protein